MYGVPNGVWNAIPHLDLSNMSLRFLLVLRPIPLAWC